MRDNMLRLAADIATGGRPAGENYMLTVTDGPRHQTDEEYQIRVRLVRYVEVDGDGPDEEVVLVDERVYPYEWRDALAEFVGP